MEGHALAQRDRFDMAMVVSWHTASFGLGMYAGKLKGKRLSDFLAGEKPQRSKSADAIAFFHALKAQGVPIKITRLN